MLGDVVEVVGNPERNHNGFFDNLIPTILDEETLNNLF